VAKLTEEHLPIATKQSISPFSKNKEQRKRCAFIGCVMTCPMPTLKLKGASKKIPAAETATGIYYSNKKMISLFQTKKKQPFYK